MDGILDRLEIANFAFDVDLLIALKKAGKPVVEVAISWEDVVEYSKVRLLRSGPAMLWALLRLFVRDSVFGRLPFADAVGRSQTIPVVCGLDMLFLVSRRHRSTEQFLRVVEGLRERGHIIRVVRIENFGALASFMLWYVRSGHLICNAIVHDRSKFSARIIEMSAKPKFSLREVEAGTMQSPQFLDSFVNQVANLNHRSSYFSRDGDGWTLATQRLEASQIDTISTLSGR
jgi:hypothetical protein